MTGPTVHPADLAPSLIAERTYYTRRRIPRIDAALLLTFMVILLTVLPARLAVPGMSSPGRPALLVALALFGWWGMARLNPRLAMVGPQPLRWAVFVYVLSILFSYAAGFLRGLTTMEANSADRWILGTLSFCGVMLTTADGVVNWDRVRSILRVFVWCCVFMAIFGLAQFLFLVDFAQYITIPGLETVGSVPLLEARGAGIRVAATTTHYIELSAILAMALPFAIHFARFAPVLRHRRLFAGAALLIAAGNVVTFSRTGLVAIAISALFVMPLWPWRLRYNVMALGAMLMAGLAVAKPSMMATVLAMFTGASQDNSITSRTERYEMVGYYFVQRPWFGRGTGTWVPPQYQYLDNQWLSIALTNGLVGVAALLFLHAVAIALGVIALRRATAPEDRHLCAALVSVQVIALFVAATFDSMWYSTYAMVIALLAGLCGTVWRLSHPAQSVRTSLPRWYEP